MSIQVSLGQLSSNKELKSSDLLSSALRLDCM